jgi:peptidoglycan/xylan/chitin deacetylase (PgdA/CDA1 family)
VGRIIKRENNSTTRDQLIRSVVCAIRELALQKTLTAHSYDLVAFISLALIQVDGIIEQSVIAWEKRGYWVKADRYRMEWGWTKTSGEKLLQSLNTEDWTKIIETIAFIGQKLSSEKVSINSRVGTPWVGAWKKVTGS